MDPIFFKNKKVFVTEHAILRAEERNIAYPDQIYDCIRTGKVFRFGKNFMRFVKKSSSGSIICIGEDLGDSIIIKTIERGN